MIFTQLPIAGPGNGSFATMDKQALTDQGFNPTNDTAGNYPVTVSVDANTGVATITVGCKGSGTASWNSDTGVVTKPAS